ncbi:MAG: flippase-like domain-containing protein [Roseiflexaceae bacterium]|nr:flippase-like domain-containing protein [Roseiflexaceae bacterium]
MNVRRLQVAFSLLLTIAVAVLVVLNFSFIVESLRLAADARLEWVIVAFVLELFGFFVASQVYRLALKSLGYAAHHPLRLWAAAMIAIVMSQSFPAGGVASYAFLVHSFRRRGVSSAHSALIASLEALSYGTAMILLFGFSLIYILLNGTLGSNELSSIAAALVGVVIIGAAAFVLTREETLLLRGALMVKRTLEALSRRSWGDEGVTKAIGELARGRELITARWTDMLIMIVTQLAALTIHSLALMAVLYSLGAVVSLPVVLAAFGVALVSSTFNVLPGGGGTVEAAIVLTLQGLGVGPAAVPATVIFRLLNYWCMVPIALIGYRMLMHGAVPEREDGGRRADEVELRAEG